MMRTLFLVSLSVAALGCATSTTHTPDPARTTQPRAETPRAPASAAASASSAAKKTIPTFAFRKLEGVDGKLSRIFAVENAVLVVDGIRVGRLDGDKIEWLASIPKSTPMFGENVILSVHGRWPDRIGAVYRTSEGRAPSPTYFPLVGKGVAHAEAPGGGLGTIFGVARIGESTVVGGFAMDHGVWYFPVHGPQLRRVPQSAQQGGCKANEGQRTFSGEGAALWVSAAESTRAGSLVAIGSLCQKSPAAEVWDVSGQPRIVPLGSFWKKVPYDVRLLKGPGDEIWVIGDAFAPILHFRAGVFEAVPPLGRPFDQAFVSGAGVLHVLSDMVVHRFDGAWSPVGKIAKESPYPTLAMDGDALVGDAKDALYRLSPGALVPYDDECTTHFVYLYDAFENNAADYAYPTTKKALSSFAGAGEIELVELHDMHRRLGVKVRSRAQGEALMAHIKTTMPDESPRLFCYAPSGGRKI